MELVRSGLTYDVCLVYLDDILIFSKTFDEHLDSLTTVFDRLDRYVLKLKPSKCSLFQRKVSFLGHVVSSHGIECDPDKVASNATWPTPVALPKCAPSAAWQAIITLSYATSLPLRDPCITSPRRGLLSSGPLNVRLPSSNLSML